MYCTNFEFQRQVGKIYCDININLSIKIKHLQNIYKKYLALFPFLFLNKFNQIKCKLNLNIPLSSMKN